MVPTPIDKYGKPIYSKPYAKIVKNSNILNKRGYIESSNKPNLFYKKIPEGMLFADMRSSDVIPIWEDTRPLFYWQFNDNVPMWKRRRIIKQELIDNYGVNCPCRLSFYAHYKTKELEEVSCYISEDEGIFEWHDGYCLFCHKDLESNNFFCNDKCKNDYEDSHKNECKLCEKKLNWDEEIGHHLNYGENVTITVCRSCHAKIHLSQDEEYADYQPVDKRPKKEKRYILPPCAGGCGKNAKVRMEEYDPDKAYSCYKCNQQANRWVAKVKAEREKKDGKLSYIEWGQKHG